MKKYNLVSIIQLFIFAFLIIGSIFAVGFLGGKSAHVTSDIEPEKGETDEQGSDRKRHRDKQAVFTSPLRV